MLARAAAAEEELALQAPPQRLVISGEEFAIGGDFAEADLVADAVGDGGHGFGVGVAKHLFERLKLVDAVDVELDVGEGVGLAGGFGGEEVGGELAARGLDHPGAGEQVADAEAILVEPGEEEEERRPAE